MKRFVCLVVVSWLSFSVIAQTSLYISTGKTTSLIFPCGIKHVDRGSGAVLAQTIKDAPSVLLVKAGTKDFPETNLSVVTEDGSLHSFRVCYEENPSTWVYRLPVEGRANLSVYANAILDNPQTMHGIKDENWEITSKLKGIYVKDDVLYYQLFLENKSPIDFTIDLIRFYVTDKKKGKRTAVQENECTPLYVAGKMSEVKANSSVTMVVALKAFTIPDAKYLGVQILEKGGGRQLFMKVGNKKLMQAVPLPDLK